MLHSTRWPKLSTWYMDIPELLFPEKIYEMMLWTPTPIQSNPWSPLCEAMYGGQDWIKIIRSASSHDVSLEHRSESKVAFRYNLWLSHWTHGRLEVGAKSIIRRNYSILTRIAFNSRMLWVPFKRHLHSNLVKPLLIHCGLKTGTMSLDTLQFYIAIKINIFGFGNVDAYWLSESERFFCEITLSYT